MDNSFDLVAYMEGLTQFTLDIAVYNRIILDRGLSHITDYSELTQRDKDLLLADILYTVYCSPNTLPSHSISHGGFSKTIGQQVVNKDDLMNIFLSLYNKYDDERANEFGGLKWL